MRSAPVAGPPILVDVLSRVPRPNYWRDPSDPGCVVTWSHEATHGLSTVAAAGRGRFAVYVGDGRAWVFEKQPAVTIGQVAASVPAGDRGPIFDLYLVQQRRDWDREPLYLLDEWNAYVHGSLARRQAGVKDRQETERHALEMERYCRRMLDVVKANDPTWPELGRLSAMIEWQSARFSKIVSADVQGFAADR